MRSASSKGFTKTIQPRSLLGTITRLITTMGMVALLSMTTLAVAPAAAVVGGTTPSPTPKWNVVIKFQSKNFCSGALIAQSWVLTASHCVRDEVLTNVYTAALSPSVFTLYIGGETWGSSGGVTRSIDRIVALNVAFAPNAINDLALLHLSTPVPSSFAPLPLAFTPSVSYPGLPVQLFGWGSRVVGGSGSTIGTLLQSTLPGDWTIDASCTAGAGDLCFSSTTGTKSYGENGDSGAPVVSLLRGGYVDESTFSGPPGTNGQAPPVAYGSSVLSHLSWIRSTAGLPVVSANTIIRDPNTGTSWLVEADGFRHWIPTGGDYLCFEAQGDSVDSLSTFSAESIPQDYTSNATCSNSSTPTSPPTSTESLSIGWSTTHPTWITMTLNGFAPGSYTYSCDFGSGGDESFSLTETSDPQTFDNGNTCFDGITGDTVWVSIGSVTSNTIVVGSAAPTPPPPSTTWSETTGTVASTWSDYSDAGGTPGPSLAAHQTVQIACKVVGFEVADGNTWWYRIASAPWSNNFYVSADPFYNNGSTSGPISGTPFVDNNVPNC
jgi:hypothetical protein